ncbi:MAG: bifunctional precorrin-2 dehydrogenase/sirohydrochlorin ferrochelatase [Thermodesulfobacteriota bacterium]|nr:bifunctional precorrin-2 dehydrogenase/sirohydrochlorin ferrochelatase [Thermodesulfobacteriota bacterium]
MLLYPVNLAISGRLCLVIGGGEVASRKVESLLPCGAVIRIISPEIDERLAELAKAGLLEWQQREYLHGDLQGANLVFAATDNREIQNQIVTEANESGIVVNVVDMPEACTFQVPASFRRGELLITVATGGGSPALAARIRKNLESFYGPEYGLLVGLMAELRKEIVGRNDAQVEHKKLFARVLDSDILDCIREQKWETIEVLLRDILPSTIDVPCLMKEMHRSRGKNNHVE